MPRYWIIAPIESDPPQLLDKVWQCDLGKSLISIGWVQLGDVSKLSRTELAEKVASTYPDTKKGLVTKMIWSFYHDIIVGDFVIARRGKKGSCGRWQSQPCSDLFPGKESLYRTSKFFRGLMAARAAQ